MKRSLVILMSALSISAMTAGSIAPVWAENTAETEAAETTDEAEESADSELEDGVYSVEFDTDSGMFHVNEACNGRATLTVKDGKMTVHISLVSKNCKSFPGNCRGRTEGWCQADRTYHRRCNLQRWTYGRSLWLQHSGREAG